MLVAQLSMTDKHWLPLRANLALACIAVVTVGAVASIAEARTAQQPRHDP
jgi:hypothetical protein